MFVQGFFTLVHESSIAQENDLPFFPFLAFCIFFVPPKSNQQSNQPGKKKKKENCLFHVYARILIKTDLVENWASRRGTSRREGEGSEDPVFSAGSSFPPQALPFSATGDQPLQSSPPFLSVVVGGKGRHALFHWVLTKGSSLSPF